MHATQQRETMTTAQDTRCPRCDYELDGVIAAFTDQCPLQGTCSECGMEFDWANLLRADRRQLPWLFEHARGLVRGFAGTLWRSLFPGRFWNAVQMWHMPRLGRLWLYVVMCAGGLLMAISLLFFAIILVTRQVVTKPIPVPGRFAPTDGMHEFFQLVLYPFVVESWWGSGWSIQGWIINDRFMLMPIACFWGMSLSWPLLMLVLSDSRREAKVKRAHVLRAWAYSLWWGMGITAVFVVMRIGMLATDICSAMSWTQAYNQIWSIRQSAWQILYNYLWIQWAAPVAVLLLFAWTARWWWVVIVRYWQFSRPGLVYWLIFVVSLLAMLIPGVLGAYDLFI